MFSRSAKGVKYVESSVIENWYVEKHERTVHPKSDCNTGSGRLSGGGEHHSSEQGAAARGPRALVQAGVQLRAL